MKALYRIFTTFFLLVSTLLYGQDLVVVSPEGEYYVMSVEPEETFSNVIEQINTRFSSLPLDNIYVAGNVNEIWIDKGGKKPRDYNKAVSSKEKKEISYIVNTLAKSSLAKIATSRSSLKKSGDKVDRVHPLRFLMCCFTDEELKAGVHAIKERGWIWKEFFGGLSESLTEESSLNNLRIEQILDFAANVGINPNYIIAPIQQRQWSAFMDALLLHLPRQGNPDRYDM